MNNTFNIVSEIVKSKKQLDYDDITLAPYGYSSLLSRDEADTSLEFAGHQFASPLIASPMPDVCNGKMAQLLFTKHNTMGIIHKFMPLNNHITEFLAGSYVQVGSDLIALNQEKIACAVGTNGDYRERVEQLLELGCRTFCIDTSNGCSRRVENAVRWIRTRFDEEIFLIVGNVATGEAFERVSDWGVDAIRVGIAGGSACRTRNATGVYVPMITSVAECAYSKYINGLNTLIIADGGIKEPGDMAKILAVGADMILAGSIFAATHESPASHYPSPLDDSLKGSYKLYRGAASESVQEDANGYKPRYVEGSSGAIEIIGTVEEMLNKFIGGLKSSMSYFNARTIQKFKDNVDIRVIK